MGGLKPPFKSKYMKTYKVKVFKHLLKNNKIAKKGDTVKENQLINKEASIKGEFVEEVKSKSGAKKDSNKSGEGKKDSGKSNSKK